MHTHFSVMSAVQVFLLVLAAGTAWRLGSYHLTASANENVSHIGKAMAFQY